MTFEKVNLRDDQILARVNYIRMQSVGALETADGDAMVKGDTIKGVATVHGIAFAMRAGALFLRGAFLYRSVIARWLRRITWLRSGSIRLLRWRILLILRILRR